MALPTSGILSLYTIQSTMGGSNPIGMNEYYGWDGITAGPTIAISSFYGHSKPSGSVTYTSAGSFVWYAPAGVYSVTLCMIGGGGGGGERGRNEDSYNGGGYRGAYYSNSVYTVSPGSGYTVKVGAGGARGVQASGSAGGLSQFGAWTRAGGAGGMSSYMSSTGYLGGGSTATCYGTYAGGTNYYDSVPNNMYYGAQAGFYIGRNGHSGIAAIRGSGGAAGNPLGAASQAGGVGLVRITWG